jgi:CDP-diglyceride synthetase
MELHDILETLMIVCFGVSWPMSIIRSVRSKSTKGKSLLFMGFIALGYLCGIISKLMSHTYNLAFWFYFPNIIMVLTDIALYFRNRRYEKLKGE